MSFPAGSATDRLRFRQVASDGRRTLLLSPGIISAEVPGEEGSGCGGGRCCSARCLLHVVFFRARTDGLGYPPRAVGVAHSTTNCPCRRHGTPTRSDRARPARPSHTTGGRRRSGLCAVWRLERAAAGGAV